MRTFILHDPSDQSELSKFVAYVEKTTIIEMVESLDKVNLNQPCRVIFAASLDWLGESRFISDQLKFFAQTSKYDHVQGALLLYSGTYWHTKRYAQRIIFVLNQRGMYFEGHSVFEIMPNFENFKTWQKLYDLSLEEVCYQRLSVFCQNFFEVPNTLKDESFNRVLVLHASHHPISNTYMLWEKVRTHLKDFDIQVYAIENGKIQDCKGCSFKTCEYYSQNRSCYYSGEVTEEVLPAIEWAQIVIWICPNYNDAISAMHTALINRLTVLYRRISFKPKQMYGIIVSGNSGCDSVASQLIGALHINKGFQLPPKAFLTAIANEPGSIQFITGIDDKAKDFAMQFIKNTQK
jgi:multimeric flavodoxin WrbA